MMYQTQQNYYQNLGTAGHRATSSYNYLPQYTPGEYGKQNLFSHRASNSFYLGASAGGGAGAHQAQFLAPPPVVAGQGGISGGISGGTSGVMSSGMSGGISGISGTISGISGLGQQLEFQNVGGAAIGGVNAVLDYDLSSMSAFLSWCTFGMMKQDRKPSKEFEKLVVSVLYATRLPKSTIIIALEYMNQRYSTKNLGSLTEREIFVKAIVSLILANKFNDDNTFTNRSWCGASGLQVAVLNKEEMEWLKEVNWQLNVVSFEANIRTLEECWKTWLEKHSVNTYSPPVATVKYTPYSSIPSSPVFNDSSYTYNYSSPIASSPIKYSRDATWSTTSTSVGNNIWAYTPSYQYVPNSNSLFSDFSNQYFGVNNFVGYTNPYYNYNMASC